jgi:leucyl aminopeptidase
VATHEPGYLSWFEPRGTKARWVVAACAAPGDRGSARGVGAAIERALNDRALRDVIVVPGPAEIDLAAVVEGLLMRMYACAEFVPDYEFTSVTKIVVCVDKPDLAETRARIEEVVALVQATTFARGLADLPANVGTPAEIAARTRAGAESRALAVRTISEAQARRMGMGLFAAVAAGGGTRGCILVLEHNAERAGELPTLVLVGEGVTHDLGGYNLKSGGRLWEQTYDKAGAAAVIGAMLGIADLGVAAHVVAMAPLVENCVGPAAMKPGDIVTALDGTTVFVENTDAEGRLVLADCLVYARRYGPALVVDLATLTLSAHQALGDAYAGLFAPDEAARDLVLKAAEWAGEGVWPLPIHPSYVDALRHARAELTNSVERGGAGIAAAFLQHFTDYPWAHIDMGGKAMAGPERADVREGATGFGTRLLIRLAQLFAQQHGA